MILSEGVMKKFQAEFWIWRKFKAMAIVGSNKTPYMGARNMIHDSKYDAH